ncbi:dsDNA binding protein [Morganella phage vB_Mm5]
MSQEILETLSPDDAKKFNDFIKEASNAKTIAEGATSTISEIRKRAKSELGIKPAYFNKLFRMYHNQSRDETETETDVIVNLYDLVFPGRNDD